MALRTFGAAMRALLALTVLCGIVYPAVVLLAAFAMPSQAGGSLVTADGRVVGSRLIGQTYLDSSGKPDPRYLHGRPSAAGDQGYDALDSSGTNLGPENPELVGQIRERKDTAAAAGEATTADALTASSSGLDPDVTIENAHQQAARIAKARGVDVARVTALIDRHAHGGVLGPRVVNVLQLNIALDRELGRK